MKPLFRKLLGGMTAALVALAVLAPAAQADDTGKYLTLSLIGDSYTAGNGAGSYYGPKDSLRSTRNWGHTYSNWLNRQGVHTTIRNYAFSGAVIDDVVKTQLPALDPESDVVMLTAGGNDVEFANIVKSCFTSIPIVTSVNGCKNAMGKANNEFPAVVTRTERLLEQVAAKIRPGGQIVLVGYPLLAIENTTWKLSTWFQGSYDAAQEVRKFGQQATQRQQQLANGWNRAEHNDVGLTYIPVEVLFAGHEPDPDTGKRNDYRWINEFIETEGKVGPDGKITSKDTGYFEMAHWYHPNITGHEEIGKLLQREVGIPASVRTTRAFSRDIDLVFALEDSLDTAESLADLKKQIARITSEVSLKAAEGGKSARFGLITYRNAADPSASVTKNGVFFDSPEALTASLGAVATGGEKGGGPSTYKALDTALQSEWKAGARKVVILLGDAEAPEGETPDWDRLLRSAFTADVAEVLVIDPDDSVDASVKDLALNTGGHVTTARTLKPLIVEAPTARISTIDPAGIGEDVEFDASGSFAAEGQLVSYEWDVDGDGVFEAVTRAENGIAANPIHSVRFDAPITANVTLRVTDEYGKTATAEMPLIVTRDGDSVDDAIDNCPADRNEDQADADGDGIGDVCDDSPYGEPEAVPMPERAVVPSESGVEAGSAISFTATGFAVGQDVTFTVHSDPLVVGTARVGADGTATLRWSVPEGFSAGAHRVVASIENGHTAEASFDVFAKPMRAVAASAVLPAAPQSPGKSASALASTGGASALAAAAATLLFLAGVGVRTVKKQRA